MAPTSNTEDTLTLEKIYTELRAGIRETDNISFRLLGLVPLVSGASLIGVVLQKTPLGHEVTLLALFAAGVTFGIFRWELRNTQTCKWLIRYASCLEQRALKAHHATQIYRSLPTAPQSIGKTEAEMVIYTTTVLAWLALPVGTGVVTWPPHVGAVAVYYIVAGAIVAATFISLWANTGTSRGDDGEPGKPGEQANRASG